VTDSRNANDHRDAFSRALNAGGRAVRLETVVLVELHKRVEYPNSGFEYLSIPGD
jgi:hypothetical protein